MLVGNDLIDKAMGSVPAAVLPVVKGTDSGIEGVAGVIFALAALGAGVVELSVGAAGGVGAAAVFADILIGVAVVDAPVPCRVLARPCGGIYVAAGVEHYLAAGRGMVSIGGAVGIEAVGNEHCAVLGDKVASLVLIGFDIAKGSQYAVDVTPGTEPQLGAVGKSIQRGIVRPIVVIDHTGDTVVVNGSTRADFGQVLVVYGFPVQSVEYTVGTIHRSDYGAIGEKWFIVFNICTLQRLLVD